MTPPPESPSGRSRWRGLLALPGCLFVTPLVALLFGSEWSWEQRAEPPSAAYARNAAAGALAAGAPVAIETYLVPEGSQIHAGITLQPGESLTFDLTPIDRRFELEIQGHARDHYRIESVAATDAVAELWLARSSGSRGFRTRRAAFPAPESPIVRLRVSPAGERAVRVAGIRLTRNRLDFRHALLVPLLWGAWLLLAATGSTLGVAGRALAFWQRWDAWLAALFVVSILFVMAPEALALGLLGLLIGLGLSAVSSGLRRAPGLTVFYLAFFGLLFGVVLPRAVGWVVARKVGATFDLTVDHRMRPDGAEINSDGIRFKGESDDLDPEQFVVLVLGDSFTYGLRLAYDDTYPKRLEESLGATECSADVRTVNFGWGSSSPLLSLRLLRDVGADYQPDLVLYTLDMTDFDDDLRYERDLGRAGELEVDPGRVVRQLATTVVADLPALSELPETLARLRRDAVDAADTEAEEAPRQRFFITNQPLASSRADIERGVMKNLRAIHQHASAELGVPMALVVYPRSYQYSTRESPRNWERGKYTKLGPHVREPFNYFDEVAPSLPYPVLSLLPAFETAEEFPLFFVDDPHWNETGARLAADRVADFLLDSGLVPCRQQPAAEAPVESAEMSAAGASEAG